jgi:cell cycle arrest protein BUB3
MSYHGGPVSDEVALSPSPTDGISCVRFSDCSAEQLLVSSWDCSVRVYDVPNNRLRLKMEVGDPVLSCCYGVDKNHAFSGGLEGSLVHHDLEHNSNNRTHIGSHSRAISCVRYSASTGLVYSGSWDEHVCSWDPRSSSKDPAHRLQQNGRVFSMSIHEYNMVVGTSAKKVVLYDVRQMDQPVDVRDSPMKYQIRCVEIFPNGQGTSSTSLSLSLSNIYKRVSSCIFNMMSERAT